MKGSFLHEAEVQRRWRLAVVMMLSLTAHNLPEGFAVGISALGSDRLGFVVMFAIALHNIPEGIALAVPVLSATGSKKKALWMSFLSGMAEPLGAAVALFVASILDENVSSDAVEDLLCAVGGVMCAVALKELLPEALRQQQTKFAVGGLVTGFLVMWLTSYYT
jgi:ZIP family zinc transporter